MKKLVYISLITLLAACGGKQGGDKKAELEKLQKERSALDTKIAKLEGELKDTTQKATEVIVTPVQPETFKSYIEVQGRVDADENVSLSTEIPGTVTRINVKVGDRVSKGQVLAETDVRAVQQQLAELKTNLDLAAQVYQKQKNLWDQKIGTEIQYLQSKNGKESLENKIAAMNEQIRMSRIISPIDGTVDLVSIKVGQSVAPGGQSINVVNFSNLKVKADVAESYAARVKPGNEVKIYFPDINDSLTAKISYASRAISNLSRTFAIEIPLDNSKEYHPNSVAKLFINDYKSDAPELVVPVKYIQRGTNENYVFVAENGKVIKKVIKTGREYNGTVEVTSGLKQGDQLITAGYDLVNEGDAITVKK